ncbi:CoA transferase [Propionimicrobium sp. PCR01-08-3]|uniref:CaiB/BaiF CoA transferase family protein n=1 Tax=Propionimicrobium sp. PCR01-08-3 TaxID=3052086 RepID=UPI00255C5B6B|nr:CoA transferase [Propionimicrobium sp. PCR01-08-3]WIY82787.1 CoA transferase [Propionimicrobium sp. PCR01-08-3]
MNGTGPLAGFRVVEFSHFIAAPSVGQRLAELGAEVTKIEPPAGDPTRPEGRAGSAIFETYNRGKRSIVLDLNDPDDEALAFSLASGADIVIHNMSAASLARHGLDGASVRAANPQIIYGSVRGFPSNTRRAHDKGFDGIGQAESGMLWVNGTAESGPLKLPYSPVDTVTGDALLQAVLAAVIKRLRTGEGSEVEVSLFEGGLHLQQTYWADFLQSGVSPDPIGNLEPSVAPAAEILKVADGTVIMSAYLPPHWEALCGLLGLDALVADPRFVNNEVRLANQVELHGLIQDALERLGWTVAEASEAFDGIRIPHGVVGSYQDIFDGGLLQESGQLAVATRANGTQYQVFNAPYRVIGDDRPRKSAAPPVLGADGDIVRAEVARGEWGTRGSQSAADTGTQHVADLPRADGDPIQQGLDHRGYGTSFSSAATDADSADAQDVENGADLADASLPTSFAGGGLGSEASVSLSTRPDPRETSEAGSRWGESESARAGGEPSTLPRDITASEEEIAETERRAS